MWPYLPHIAPAVKHENTQASIMPERVTYISQTHKSWIDKREQKWILVRIWHKELNFLFLRLQRHKVLFQYDKDTGMMLFAANTHYTTREMRCGHKSLPYWGGCVLISASVDYCTSPSSARKTKSRSWKSGTRVTLFPPPLSGPLKGGERWQWERNIWVIPRSLLTSLSNWAWDKIPHIQCGSNTECYHWQHFIFWYYCMILC